MPYSSRCYWINTRFEGHRLTTGIVGAILIVLSFGYSLRKRNLLFTFGDPKYWLVLHEGLAITGTFAILIHTGTHFKALVPVITLICMFTAFLSGLTGRYVYRGARLDLIAKQKALREDGLSSGEIEQKLWSLAVASETLSNWRKVHRPVVVIMVLMTVYHAISALYYRGI